MTSAARAELRGLLAGLMLWAGPVLAQDQTCVARVNGTDVVVAAGAVLEGASDTTLRERLLSWPRQTWNQTWGAPLTCDSETTIAFLGAVLAVDQIDTYCLSYEAETDGFLLVPGSRNFRGRCQKTICERVNIARDQTTGFIGGMMQAVLQPPQTGLLGLTHSSGAMLLTGQRGVLLETLGTTATSVTAALSTPAALTATAVTVMTVGSAVYVCSE